MDNKYTVRYCLTPEQTAQLSRITDLYNNIADMPQTPAQLFDSLMLLGSTNEITEKLDFYERNFAFNKK